MSYSFRVLQTKDTIDPIIKTMHRLRKRVFIDELKWTAGMIVVDNIEEYDEYDDDLSYYLIKQGVNGEVYSCCRLRSTTSSYMIKDKYPEFIDPVKCDVPNEPSIWEITRFCVAQEVRGKRESAELVAASIKFGIIHNITSYVALASDMIVPFMDRIIGWDPTPIGSRQKMPDDYGIAVRYTVNDYYLDKICARYNIDCNKLFQ